MKRLYCQLFLAVLLCLSVCSNATELFGTWRLTMLEFEFGDKQPMEPGNFIVLAEDHVVEIIKDNGKRRYDGQWQGRSFLQGATGARWDIVSQDDEVLRVKTPIAVYVLEPDD